ncbi:MAG: hypothetical protein U9N57_06275 [Pseudomonadota bacterium]|nr:hypothetical protein [Pseudomonadota bacterium]
MAKFNNLSALDYLLKMDTNIFKEEMYYPWYIQRTGLQIVIASWVLFILIFEAVMFTLTDIIWWLPLMIGFVLSVIFTGAYFALISQTKKTAKNESLKQMMRLEKEQFMQNIEPFVADDQKGLVKRISTQVDFSPNEYISLAIATKSRAIFNTDAFIQDIERMFAHKQYKAPDFDDNGYSDTVFSVPASAKKNYEKMKNASTFNDELEVTPQVQAAIMKKVRNALDRQALGREG